MRRTTWGRNSLSTPNRSQTTAFMPWWGNLCGTAKLDSGGIGCCLLTRTFHVTLRGEWCRPSGTKCHQFYQRALLQKWSYQLCYNFDLFVYYLVNIHNRLAREKKLSIGPIQPSSNLIGQFKKSTKLELSTNISKPSQANIWIWIWIWSWS